MVLAIFCIRVRSEGLLLGFEVTFTTEMMAIDFEFKNFIDITNAESREY
jgi:hypothetical protein